MLPYQVGQYLMMGLIMDQVTLITVKSCQSLSVGTFGKSVESGPAGLVLAGPLFIKVKTKFHLQKVSNKQKR